jgi:transcriptional regulator with XRE-family HTH domain
VQGERIGPNLRQMRRMAGLSQAELGQLAGGIGQDTVSGIELGKHEPHASTLRKIAKALTDRGDLGRVRVVDFYTGWNPESEWGKAEAPQESEASTLVLNNS